jgi:hypothetical protein
MKKTKTCGERRKKERNKEGNKQVMFNGFVWNPDTNKQTQNPQNSDQKKKQTHQANYYNYFIATDCPSLKNGQTNNT